MREWSTITTSSTAQGGGGSFKNRKPIAEVGCCESGMAERSHWWTERCLISLTLSPAFSDYLLPTYLSIFYVCMYLSIYLSNLSISLSISLSIYPSIYLSIYLSLSLSLSLSIYLSIYPSIYLSLYLSIYLSIYLSLYLSFFLSIYLSIYLIYLSIYLNLQKWSDHGVLCTFWLGNVLRATTACTFSTSQLPKVVRPWCALYILTWKCASRHDGVHFFDISTSKSGPRMVCFVHFDLEMCFAPQRRALFRHRNFQKWSEPGVFCTFWLGNVLRATTARTFSTSQLPKVVREWCVLYIFTWKCASRHNGVQFFISPLASWLRTRRFSEPTFRPSGAKNHWKNTVFRDFPTFSRICIFCLLTLSLLIFLFSMPLPCSAFHLSILSEVWLLNFLRSKIIPATPIPIHSLLSTSKHHSNKNPPNFYQWHCLVTKPKSVKRRDVWMSIQGNVRLSDGDGGTHLTLLVGSWEIARTNRLLFMRKFWWFDSLTKKNQRTAQPADFWIEPIESRNQQTWFLDFFREVVLFHP